MSDGYSLTVTAFMTPRDLREIADEMEAKWASRIPGQSLEVRQWYVSSGCTINFVVDQGRMGQQAKDERTR